MRGNPQQRAQDHREGSRDGPEYGTLGAAGQMWARPRARGPGRGRAHPPHRSASLSVAERSEMERGDLGAPPRTTSHSLER